VANASHADRYDRQLQPIADAQLERVRPQAHQAVLDVGRGSGATTITAASAVRNAHGVDISEPLLGVAVDRARAASVDNADVTVADAQTYAFTEGSFDVIISQFGVMFFDHPVAGFTNLRCALAPDGQAVFTCWQGLEANQWVPLVADAVAQRRAVPDLGGQDGGPGMFALEHPDEYSVPLDAAGFTRIEIEAIGPTIVLGGGGPRRSRPTSC